MPSYTDFLETKRRLYGDHGSQVDPAELHPSLFPFQRDVTTWAIRKGRAALFLDTGLGKTRCQIEWATHSAETSLILAPLSVARQTVREAAKIDAEVRYVRHPDQVTGPGVWITNYEMADRFDPADFGAVVIDESAILKQVDSKTRELFTDMFSQTPRRLACTATPAPNDVAELTNHAEFLGIMPRTEMLAAYFVHDDEGWRPKGHALEPMYRFISTWATAMRRPSDLGYSDAGYELPPLSIVGEVVEADVESEDQLFLTELGGITGRSQIRRETLNARVERAVELTEDGDTWVIWCGLNDEANLAAKAIEGSVNVEGSWAPERKAEALEAFQDGQIRVMITKARVAGWGMNFQHCARMAFVGLSDSWESYYQCIRRCYRFGQTRPVVAHVIVSELERQIVDNVRRKEVEAVALTDALIRIAAEEWNR